ncbi:MAG: thioredoxin family protein [Planctomycetota bacterium]
MKNTTRNYLMMGLVIVAVLGLSVFNRSRSHSLAAGLPDDSVIGKGKPVVIQFGAHWCPPCRKQLPVMIELAKEQTAFQTAFLDVDEHPQTARDNNIGPIPTLIFFDGDGNELDRHTGFYPKDSILTKWKELGVDATSL